MMALLNKWLGINSRLSEVETLILEAVKDRLDPGSNELLGEQLQAINKIQRLSDGIEVYFYRMKGYQPSFDEDIAFANKSELQLAKVQIRIPDFRANLTANVWCIKGYLYSIEYEGSVSYFEEAAEMDPRPMFFN